MPISALIADDEASARSRLRRLLAPYSFELLEDARDGLEALEAIQKHRPQVLFLDVQMPGLGGFEVVEALTPDAMPLIVFVTAYDDYALRAFEAHALDYLLKPFDEARFRDALARAKAHVRATRGSRPRLLDRLIVKSGGRFVFVKAEEIDWVEAQGNYVRLHSGGAAHLLRDSIGKLEGRLDPDRFLRIHRSTIVNLDRVREIAPLFHGEHAVVLADGTRLTLSRGYRDRLSRFEPR